MQDCTNEYRPEFIRSAFKGILKLIKIKYELTQCKGSEKQKIDIIYYALIAAFFIISLLILLLFLFLLYKCLRCQRNRSLKGLDNEALAKSTLEKYTKRSSDNFFDGLKHDQGAAGVENANTDTDPANAPVSNEFEKELNLKLLKRRLEMMEHYRRLLINQMVKREKQEETYVEKFGNLIRDSVNYLFGDPRRGLDLTDPQVMFYPYWPQRNDYSLLTAYGAVREHMMHDANLFAPPPPAAPTPVSPPFPVPDTTNPALYQMPRYTTAINNDLTRQLLNQNA